MAAPVPGTDRIAGGRGGVTTTLRVGCRVFCTDYHVPGVLIKEAATLDLLSDGRFEFGIGCGWSEHEYRAMGVPFAPAPERVSKLEEVVALFKAHCTGQPLDLSGEYVTAQDYAGLPLPVQQPHPPIIIGGSRKRVLSLAGREADIASISTVSFEPVNAQGRTPQQERSNASSSSATQRVIVSPISTSKAHPSSSRSPKMRTPH